MGHREVVMQRTPRGQKDGIRTITALHSTALGLAIRLCTSASFQEKTASTRWQMVNKKGARERPLRSLNEAAFTASFGEATSASRTGTTSAPWRYRDAQRPPGPTDRRRPRCRSRRTDRHGLPPPAAAGSSSATPDERNR